MADEKFPNEEVEKLKSLARLEETTVDADQCAACRQQRAESGDATDLCAEHLKQIYGI